MKTRVYTDGACSSNPGPGGWGAIILLPTKNIKLSGYEFETTNNRMELKAIIRGLETCIQLKQKTIEIYSDSAYAVNAVNKGWLKLWRLNGWKTSSASEVKNKDLWEKLLVILKLNLDLKFIKVKGHSGDTYNEMADKLARNKCEIAKEKIS